MPLKKLIREISVEEYSTPSPIILREDDLVEKALNLMKTEKIRHFPVVNSENEISGLVSERDLLAFNQRQEYYSRFKIKDAMISTNPYIVDETATLEEVAMEMSRNRYGSAIVTNSKREIVGIFTTTDALNALIEIIRGEID